MRLVYHWDADLYQALLRYRAQQLINYAESIKEREMAASTSADLAKLVANMKRAQALTDRAAADADRHQTIMDKTEARLNLLGENFSKMEEYEKQLAAMDQIGNGGPALDDTFQASPAVVETSTDSALLSPSVTSNSSFSHSTGDPIK